MPEHVPWLANKRWRDNTINSSAPGADSKKFPVAERLNGLAEAELLKESYEAYLGKS